jgi:hypothetical protein
MKIRRSTGCGVGVGLGVAVGDNVGVDVGADDCLGVGELVGDTVGEGVADAVDVGVAVGEGLLLDENAPLYAKYPTAVALIIMITNIIAMYLLFIYIQLDIII